MYVTQFNQPIRVTLNSVNEKETKTKQDVVAENNKAVQNTEAPTIASNYGNATTEQYLVNMGIQIVSTPKQQEAVTTNNEVITNTSPEVEGEEEPVVTVQEMQSGLGDIFRRGWNTFKTFITKEWHDFLDDPLKYIIKRAGDFLPGLWGKGCRLIHQCL